MNLFCFRTSSAATGLAAILLVVGCATPPPKPSAPAVQSCQAAPAGDVLIGTWLGVHKQKGVAGELHILFDLRADGTMSYTEQLKRGKRPPQWLNEMGCWNSKGQTLTLRTLTSNGVPVESADPIYTNQYTIGARPGKELSLQGAQRLLKARRMPAGYRMPY